MKIPNKNRLVIGASLWALILSVFLVDYVVIYRMNFFIFYLVPVLMVAYRLGIRHGFALSTAGAILWVIADNSAMQQYRVNWMLYWNGISRFVLFAGGASLMHFWKEAHLLSRTDSITGLSNRRSFIELLTREIERSHRYHRTFSVAYIDLDNLKAVNDKMGHKAGDRMILQLARSIHDTLRAVDDAARLGGDEFAVILPETDMDGAEVVIQKIQHRWNLLTHAKAGSAATMSVGISTFLRDAPSVDVVIQTADRLMYEAKQSGKDCIRKEVYGASSGLPD